MDQLFNSTISLMSSLDSLYNATKTNSDVILGCFSHLKKLEEVIAQASQLTAETQDILGLISSHSESSKQSIHVLDKCFTYLTTEHNHVAAAANGIGRDLKNQLEALRVENKDIHFYLCEKDLTTSELLLEQAKNSRDAYYESNFKNASPDAVDSSALKEYEVILTKYKQANSTLYSKLDQCEDFTESKIASASTDITGSEDNSKEEQTTSDAVQTTISEEQSVINETITETTSESVQLEVSPETTIDIEEVNHNITSAENTTLTEPEVMLNETVVEVIYSEDDQTLHSGNETMENSTIIEPVAVESL